MPGPGPHLRNVTNDLYPRGDSIAELKVITCDSNIVFTGVGLRHYNAMSPHPVYSPEQAPPYCYDLYNDRGGRLSGPSPTHSSGKSHNSCGHPAK